MSRTLTTDELDKMVSAYLDRLANDLGSLPVDRREALISEIRDHIDALRAENPVRDASDLEVLLARVGSTEEIAWAALEDGAVVETVPTATRRRGLLVVALIVVFLMLPLSAGLLASFTSFFSGGTPTPARSDILRPATSATITIPNVVGTSQAQACAVLAAARLTCTVRTAQTIANPPGQVVSEQPTPGSRVPSNSQVTLMVSTAPSSP